MTKEKGAPGRAPILTGAANGHTDTQEKYTPNFPLVQAQAARQALFEAARVWLARGFTLLPQATGTKFLVRGFGPTQQVIRTERDAKIWFARRGCNLAAVITPGYYVADFETRDMVRAWRLDAGADVYGYFEKVSARLPHFSAW